jgi:hypothetical protein
MLNQPRIVVAGLEAIASGSIVTAVKQDVVDIFPFSESPYLIRFKFDNDPKKDSGVSTSNLPNNSGVELILTNFDNFLTGNDIAPVTPIYVANHDGFKIYCWFVSHSLGPPATAARVLHFTFYRGEAANG